MAKKHHDKLLEAIESSDKHIKAIEATRDMALITKELTEKVKKAQEKWPLKKFSKDILNQLTPKGFNNKDFNYSDQKETIPFFNKLKNTKDNLKKILKIHIEHRPDDDQKKEMIEFFDLIVDQEPRILKNIKNVLDLPLIDKKSKENIEYFNLFLEKYNYRLQILLNHYKDYSKDLYENKKTMTQIEKLNNLIKKVLKEEMDKSQSGVLDITIPSKFAHALADPRVSDNPSYVNHMKSNDGGKTYNLSIKSKTPEFTQLKKAVERISDNVTNPEMEKVYHDLVDGIEKADATGTVDLINKERQDKKGMKEGKEESSESSKMDEDKVEYTQDGTAKTATSAQKQDAMKAKAGETVSYKKPGQMQEEDENTQEHDEYTQDIDHEDKDGEQDDLAARSLAEAAGQMKGICEAPKDAKHAKHAGKVLKHIEAANEALKGLRGHEKMLEAKQNEIDQKEGGKHLKAIEKHLGKVVKDKDAVGKMMKKMPIEKVLALKQAKGGELDEEKVAKALLKHVIKEGHFKN